VNNRPSSNQTRVGAAACERQLRERAVGAPPAEYKERYGTQCKRARRVRRYAQPVCPEGRCAEVQLKARYQRLHAREMACQQPPAASAVQDERRGIYAALFVVICLALNGAAASSAYVMSPYAWHGYMFSGVRGKAARCARVRQERYSCVARKRTARACAARLESRVCWMGVVGNMRRRNQRNVR